ncbi:MAG: hypothetical protein NC401_03975 [Ruminococcus sp.]|nr:hypothetical protein [Ruminococcus sp.]
MPPQSKTFAIMDITIIKNDDFETIGIKVTTSAPGSFAPETVFAWGKTYEDMYFSKKVRGDYYEKEIFALVRAGKQAEAASHLMQTVARVIEEAGIKVVHDVDEYGEKHGYSIGKGDYYSKIADQANAEVERLIKKLEQAIADRKKK